MRAKMPPFAGTAAERATLARWLLRRADPTPLATRAAREGRDLGDLVYAVRCGVCHVEGGFSDKGRQFEGLSVEDAKDLLGTVTFDEMPLFSGTPEELDALARHLVARAKGAAR
jgi:mono/diheme cytochrome c family protein